MSQEQWAAVDAYFDDLFVETDPALQAALEASKAAGLDLVNVTPGQGKLLAMMVRINGAKSILELGTLGGYSTIWLARSLPKDGCVITLEAEPKHAEVARANIARAGFADMVEVRVGPALDTLPKLAAEGRDPFDLVFIDADTKNNPGYIDWALKLTHRGSLIIIDNVVRHGAVLDAESDDAAVQGVRPGHEMIATEPRFNAVAIPTVGEKGYDGLVFALVTADP